MSFRDRSGRRGLPRAAMYPSAVSEQHEAIRDELRVGVGHRLPGGRHEIREVLRVRLGRVLRAPDGRDGPRSRRGDRRVDDPLLASEADPGRARGR